MLQILHFVSRTVLLKNFAILLFTSSANTLINPLFYKLFFTCIYGKQLNDNIKTVLSSTDYIRVCSCNPMQQHVLLNQLDEHRLR